MPIAQDMKSLTDRIVGDYDSRISVLGDLFSETQDTLKGFTRDRGKMADGQKKELRLFVGGLVDTTSGLLKEFAGDHKKMAAAQAKDLAKFVADMESTVKKMLKGFQDSHAEMGEELRKDLSAFAKDLMNKTKRLMAEYQEDISGAAEAWQKMAGRMPRGRHGVAVKIEKGKPISVAAATVKPKKKGRRKKRR